MTRVNLTHFFNFFGWCMGLGALCWYGWAELLTSQGEWFCDGSLLHTVNSFKVSSIPPVFLATYAFIPVASGFWPNLHYSCCVICCCSG